jgi:hypothetical protein
VKVGSAVGSGPAGADDGGAVAVGEAVAGALVEAVGLADALGVADCVPDGVADAVGAAELVVGAGAGGPKHPASANSAPTAKTLSADSLGLVMMPPWIRARVLWTLPSSYAPGTGPDRDLSPSIDMQD